MIVAVNQHIASSVRHKYFSLRMYEVLFKVETAAEHLQPLLNKC